MWTDPNGVTHPTGNDPYDTEGAAHIAFCQVCAPHFHLPGPAPQYRPIPVEYSYGQGPKVLPVFNSTLKPTKRERKRKMKTVIKWAAAGMLALLVFMLIFGAISYITAGVH